MCHLQCIICLQRYNSEDRCPRSLTCGHSICTSCLGNLLKEENLTCPKCRALYRGQVNSVDDVPKVYELLPLLQESSTGILDHDTIIRSLKKETKHATSNDALAIDHQIKLIRNQLSGLKYQVEVHDKVSEKIDEQRKKNKMLMLKEIDYLEQAHKSSLSARQSIVNSLKAVTEARTLMDTVHANEDAKKSCETSKKSLQLNQILLQRSFLEKAQKAHSAYESVLERGDGQIDEPETEALLALSLINSLKPKMLGGADLKLIEEALSGGEVWAVTTWKGHPRRAQISQEGNRLLLHALQDGEPPAESTAVEYESVLQFQMKMVPSLRVFLELSWGNGRRGKVWIRTEGTDKRTQLFRHLCLGDQGPSYVNTRMESKGIDPSGWVYVTGGEGRNNDDRKYLITNIKVGVDSPNLEPATRMEGSVEMPPDSPHYFTIYTHCTRDDYLSSHDIVGKVFDGLPLVSETYDLFNIKDVRITDCGSDFAYLNDGCILDDIEFLDDEEHKLLDQTENDAILLHRELLVHQ